MVHAKPFTDATPTNPMAAIRAKAEAIIREAMNTEHAPDYQLSLVEEWAQEIADLCPAAG